MNKKKHQQETNIKNTTNQKMEKYPGAKDKHFQLWGNKKRNREKIWGGEIFQVIKTK